jgi:hypothetical protein
MFHALPASRCGSIRSTATRSMAASRAGKAANTIRQVTSWDQANTGIRIMVMPGARSRRIVHRVVDPCRSIPAPARNMPATHSDCPGPGV